MSTPLNQLRSRKAQQVNTVPPPSTPSNIPVKDDNIVNDILQELGESPGDNDNDLNADMYRRSMDQSQVPPQKQQVSFADEKDNMLSDVNQQELNPDEIALEQQKDQSSSSFLSNYVDMSGTLGQCLTILKSAVYVFVIILVLSLSGVNKGLFSVMPQFILESGEINIYGNMIKALLGAVLFSVLNYFL
tara:strand:+ start:1038 stop:1604 length:567 start_codon:yes stop_codon:yes gene_type:complete